LRYSSSLPPVLTAVLVLMQVHVFPKEGIIAMYDGLPVVPLDVIGKVAVTGMIPEKRLKLF
jgi:hypothetical protein